MDIERFTALLRPFLEGQEMNAVQIDALRTHVALLMRWNARINLTAVRDEEHIVLRHIGESLFTARHLLPDPSSSTSVIDVGSGAGFPGLPLKVYAPLVELTLVESQNKKATFLKEAIRTLGLKKARVFAGRAETLVEKADLVTMRAVEQFEEVVHTAASLVRNDGAKAGRLALLIGERQVAAARSLVPHFAWSTPLPIPLSSARVVMVGEHRAH